MKNSIKFFSFEPHVETLTLVIESDLACHLQAVSPLLNPFYASDTQLAVFVVTRSPAAN